MIETAVRDRRTDDHVVVVLKDRGAHAPAPTDEAPTDEARRAPVAGRLRAALGAVARYLATDETSTAIEDGPDRRRVEDARHLLAVGLLR